MWFTFSFLWNLSDVSHSFVYLKTCAHIPKGTSSLYLQGLFVRRNRMFQARSFIPVIETVVYYFTFSSSVLKRSTCIHDIQMRNIVSPWNTSDFFSCWQAHTSPTEMPKFRVFFFFFCRRLHTQKGISTPFLKVRFKCYILLSQNA